MLKSASVVKAALIWVGATTFCAAYASDTTQVLSREFLMHTKDSTEINPVCLLVTQKVVAIDHLSDGKGLAVNMPRVSTGYKAAPCTGDAFSYEESPGMSGNTKITSEAAPWR
jgi:hypothetical protein